MSACPIHQSDWSTTRTQPMTGGTWWSPCVYPTWTSWQTASRATTTRPVSIPPTPTPPGPLLPYLSQRRCSPGKTHYHEASVYTADAHSSWTLITLPLTEKMFSRLVFNYTRAVLYTVNMDIFSFGVIMHISWVCTENFPSAKIFPLWHWYGNCIGTV